MKLSIILAVFLLSMGAQAQTGWQFGAGGSFAFGGSIEGDLSVQTTSPSAFGFGTIDLETETGFEIEVDARYMPKNAWGFMGGISLGSKRDIDGGNVTVSGTSIAVTGGADADTIKSTSIIANAVYRWNEFYLPFGLNISLIDYETSGFSVDTDTGFGLQLGVGYYIQDNLVVEFISKASVFELTATDTAGNRVSYMSTIYAYGALKIKYIF